MSTWGSTSATRAGGRGTSRSSCRGVALPHRSSRKRRLNQLQESELQVFPAPAALRASPTTPSPGRVLCSQWEGSFHAVRGTPSITPRDSGLVLCYREGKEMLGGGRDTVLLLTMLDSDDFTMTLLSSQSLFGKTFLE